MSSRSSIVYILVLYSSALTCVYRSLPADNKVRAREIYGEIKKNTTIGQSRSNQCQYELELFKHCVLDENMRYRSTYLTFIKGRRGVASPQRSEQTHSPSSCRLYNSMRFHWWPVTSFDAPVMTIPPSIISESALVHATDRIPALQYFLFSSLLLVDRLSLYILLLIRPRWSQKNRFERTNERLVYTL